MSTTEGEIKKIAELAYIETDTESSARLAHDVSAIMDYVEQLREVNTTHVTPLLHPLDLHQRLRMDEINEESCLAELAAIAPLFEEGLYLVPKIIDTEK